MSQGGSWFLEAVSWLCHRLITGLLFLFWVALLLLAVIGIRRFGAGGFKFWLALGGGIALAVLLWELLMRTATLLGAAVFRWQLRSVRQSRIADTFPR